MASSGGHSKHQATLGALVFYNPEHRILIAGDALWEDGFGFVMPRALEPGALQATRATLDLIATLDIRTVIPGRGDPFTDVGGALERAYTRLALFEADDLRTSRHALKVVLAFHLLDVRTMALAALPGYVSRVGIYRDLNASVLHLPPTELADLLVTSLVRAQHRFPLRERLPPGQLSAWLRGAGDATRLRN